MAAPSMAVVGIESGTTNSVVATVRDGQVVVVPNAQEGYFTRRWCRFLLTA